ncbi:MAG TPA: NUDIX domain-containing protein, partial [Chthoniobacteraceae bacterium]|nr:NUDIX domain-containing protein [Chthoniobacteraceae bacterium]
IPETARAEELSLSEWIALTNFKSGQQFSADHAQDVHAEMFDVVDDQNHVVRQASRFEVHGQRLKHRAVHIFVLNRHGELFLQRRSRWKDAHPLRWDSSAAGHLNAGQGYDETAPRELMEELGIEANCQMIGTLPASAATGWEFVQLYRAEHDGPFRLAPAEIDSGNFFTLEQLDRWTQSRPRDFANGFLECYKLFRRL